MKKFLLYLFLLSVALFSCGVKSFAQITADVVHVEDNMLTVSIDRRNKDEYKHLLEYFGLQEDSLFLYANIGKLKAEGWVLISLTKNTATIGKLIQDDANKINWTTLPFFFDENTPSGSAGYPAPVPYGINDFKGMPTVFENDKGQTVFLLKNNMTAGSVFLSGNFNNWSTAATAMQKTDSGWVAILNLKPGKYFYKYIVDGNWIYDTKNELKEDDGYSSFNSTYFRYNYTFHLPGHTEAKNVFLAGSFNNWNEKELKMHKLNGGWQLNMYLNNGTHTYKFIADGNWIVDPANKTVKPDGVGNFNSSISLGDTTIFKLKGHTDARTVILTGSFNNWNTAELEMERTADGWQLPYVLPAGNHGYKFIVDGNWITDPDNPLQTGDAEHRNSIRVIDPNYTFVLKGFADAKDVQLSGSFNDWADPGFKMKYENGVWSLPLYLNAGKYTYKYIVDGNWILDPGNNLMEENEYSTGNSVLWIDPAVEYSGK